MKITIKEAKAQLNKVTTLEALSNHALHLDERKGVKQAIVLDSANLKRVKVRAELSKNDEV